MAEYHYANLVYEPLLVTKLGEKQNKTKRGKRESERERNLSSVNRSHFKWK